MSRNSYITEQDVENMALDSLEKIGYRIYKSDSYTRPNNLIDAMRNSDYNNVFLAGKLEYALRKINPGYKLDIYKEAVRQFERLADNPDMMIDNHRLHQLIIGGAKVKTLDKGEPRTITLYPIDFNKVDNNEFIATNQFTVRQNEKERRPDVTLFVNGLPLVTFEFKDSANENVGIQQAFSQLQTYKSEISNYMEYNEILVISDGINARAGSLTAGMDRFMRWRAPKNIQEEPGTLQLEILIKYMLLNNSYL